MALKRSFSSTFNRFTAGMDLPLFFAVLALCVFGLFNLYGIGRADNPYFIKQTIFVIAGSFFMVLCSFFNYRYLKNSSVLVFFFYIGSLILLMVPFFFHSIRGVRSWIVVGGLTFEPAELMKLIVIVLMAKYFSQRHSQINNFRHVLVSGIYSLLPAIIILVQPDLGSALIMVFIWLGMLLAVGIRARHLFVLAVLGLIFATAGWLFALKPYQKVRVLSFLSPTSDPRGSGYNLIQSKIAIGNGHLMGSGWGNGPQTANGFLPEPYNDFVFAATADQFGLVGIGAALAAVMFIIFRVLVIGQRSSSNFGKLFSLGMTIFIATHAIVGAGVNLGLMPVTGLPFPFISYGGSNLISLMGGLGILQSVKRYG